MGKSQQVGIKEDIGTHAGTPPGDPFSSSLELFERGNQRARWRALFEGDLRLPVEGLFSGEPRPAPGRAQQ